MKNFKVGDLIRASGDYSHFEHMVVLKVDHGQIQTWSFGLNRDARWLMPEENLHLIASSQDE